MVKYQRVGTVYKKTTDWGEVFGVVVLIIIGLAIIV